MACFLCLELSAKFLSYFEDVDYSIEVMKFVSSSVPQSQKVLCFVVSHSVSNQMCTILRWLFPIHPFQSSPFQLWHQQATSLPNFLP